MRGRVVVERDVAGLGVEVDGGDDEVRGADVGGRFGEEGEEGDVGSVMVVGLVVADYAGGVGGARGRGWVQGRHAVGRCLG